MLGAAKGMCSTGSQLVFSSLDCVARNAMLMFPDRMMVFDQAPIMLPAAECAAHRYLASSEHDEIARLSVELGFQVAARCRARELYAGLYAHRDTPPLPQRHSAYATVAYAARSTRYSSSSLIFSSNASVNSSRSRTFSRCSS